MKEQRTHPLFSLIPSLMLCCAFSLTSYAANVVNMTEYTVQKSDGSTKNIAAISERSSGSHGGIGGNTQQGTGARRWHTEGETLHPLDETQIDIKALKDLPYKGGSRSSAYCVVPRVYFDTDQEITKSNIDSLNSSFSSDVAMAGWNGTLNGDGSDGNYNAQSIIQDFCERLENKTDENGNPVPWAYEANGIIITRTFPRYPSYDPTLNDGFFTYDTSLNDNVAHGTLYTFEAGLVNPNTRPANIDGKTSVSYTDVKKQFPNNTATQSAGIESRMRARYKRPGLIPKKPQDPETETDTTSGRTGKDKPDLYTYHTSNQFDVGRGIPSSESMENGFGANKWYGFYAWKGKKKTKDFTATYTVSGYYWKKHYYWYYHDNDSCSGHRRSYWLQDGYYKYNIPISTQRSASYYGINQIEIFQLKNINVQNGSYGQVSYDLGVSVPVTAFIRHTGFAANDPVTTYQGTYDVTDTGHIEWPASSVHDGDFTWDMDYHKGKPSQSDCIRQFDLRTKADNTSNLTVRMCNDQLTINGKQYLNGAVYSSHSKQGSANYKAPAPQSFINAELTDYSGSGGDYGQVSGKKTVTIPDETQNGKYSTTLTGTYERIVASDGVTADTVKTNQDAILAKFKNNEPVVVHTPVISPIKITDAEVKTQLQKESVIPENGPDGDTPAYKLLLDGTYTVEFQPKQWFSAEFGKDSPMKGYENGQWMIGGENADSDDTADRYDKYVNDKKIRFPFPVQAQSEDNQMIYYPLKDDGYTDWISFPNNTIKFYVPTWVQENTTKWNGNTADLYDIQVRVEAINAVDNDQRTEDTYNTQLNNHVATYHVYANISGRVYGFQIVGTNDKDMFDKYSDKTSNDTFYGFTINKEEKKVGSFNRFGDPFVRYTLDGQFYNGGGTAWNSQDTLPLRQGSSHTYSGMGALWKGSTFAYSFKTIANLSENGTNGAKDEVDITPTYRFVTLNQNGQLITYQQSDSGSSKLLLYYSDSNGNFMQYGDGRDNSNKKSATLSHTMFKGSWYQGLTFIKPIETLAYSVPNVLNFTATHDGVSENSILSKKSECYTLSSIILNPDLRLLTGDPEELAINEKYIRSQSAFNTYSSIYNQEADGENKFKSSMQTWYGMYTIPSNFYVTTQGRLDATKADGVPDTNGNGHIDLNEYANAGKLSEDSSIFFKTGYLILNFDIKTKNGGVDHLQYGGNNATGTNMWRVEGQPTSAKVTFTTSYKTGNQQIIEKNIPVQSGDVAVIDVSHKLSDKYQGRIFMIN